MWSLLVLLADPARAGVEEGRALYVAKCQACHGASGKGDGPAARALPKKPKDFTSSEFWAGTTDESLKAVILNGLPGTIMRGFAPMGQQQLADLITYLKSLAPPPKP